MGKQKQPYLENKSKIRYPHDNYYSLTWTPVSCASSVACSGGWEILLSTSLGCSAICSLRYFGSTLISLADLQLQDFLHSHNHHCLPANSSPEQAKNSPSCVLQFRRTWSTMGVVYRIVGVSDLFKKNHTLRRKKQVHAYCSTSMTLYISAFAKSSGKWSSIIQA